MDRLFDCKLGGLQLRLGNLIAITFVYAIVNYDLLALVLLSLVVLARGVGNNRFGQAIIYAAIAAYSIGLTILLHSASYPVLLAVSVCLYLESIDEVFNVYA